MKKELNVTMIYVLSISSLLCCCFGGIGVFLAGPALLMANKKLKEAQANPEEYDPNSIKAMKTARIVAIITLVINAINLVTTIFRLCTTDWDIIMNQYKEALNQAGAQ